MHRIIKGAIIAATSLVAIGAGSAAHASVTVTSTTTSTGTSLSGFIGKGDVQTALGGLNNSAIQKLVDTPDGIKFTSTQAGIQALSSKPTQYGTQAGTEYGTQWGTQVGTETTTQEVTETLSCTKTNGNIEQQSRHGERSVTRTATRQASRDASRDASRSASRVGSRTGTRTGTLSGNINADIDAKARKTGQWTGWNVKGFLAEPKFAGSGEEGWDQPDFSKASWELSADAWVGSGEWSPVDNVSWKYAADFNFGDPIEFPETRESLTGVVWSAWEYDPNANPEGVCKEGDKNIVSYHDEFEFADTEIDVDRSAPVTDIHLAEDGHRFESDGNDPVPTGTDDGTTVYGAVTPTPGTFKLFVNTKPLPITSYTAV